MAKRGAAARRMTEDAGRNDPSRADNIPPREGDDAGAVVDATGKDDVVDVNATRDDDARPDAVKEEERRREAEEAARLGRVEGGGDGPDDDGGEDNSAAARRARRKQNRRRELGRESNEEVTNLTAQNRAMAAELAKLKRGGNQKELESSIGQIKAEIDSLKKDLFAHTEAGKTAEALDAQIKIGELQAKLALKERDLETAKRTPDPEEADSAATSAATGATPGRPKIVNDFLAANRRWWKLPSAAPLVRAAQLIDEEILAEIRDGDLDFDKYSEDHMDEMTERLAKEAQRLGLDFEIKDFNGELFTLADEDEELEEPAATGRDARRQVKTNGNRRPAAGGLGGREGGRKPPSDLELARQGKARLTEEDYAQMRVYKLDPNDEATRVRFAKERVRTILTEARKGGAR